MVMIAVVTALAMRLPNPRMVAIDFLYGTLAALPLGRCFPRDYARDAAKYAAVYQPGGDGLFIGIEVQKRRLGSLGRWPAPLIFGARQSDEV